MPNKKSFYLSERGPMKKFKLKLYDETDGEITREIYGDIIKIQPFGILISQLERKRDYIIKAALWRQIELGDYETAKSQSKNINYKVSIDDTTYDVSEKPEFDNNGNMTLSITEVATYQGTVVNTNLWMLVLSPLTYSVVVVIAV